MERFGLSTAIIIGRLKSIVGRIKIRDGFGIGRIEGGARSSLARKPVIGITTGMCSIVIIINSYGDATRFTVARRIGEYRGAGRSKD